MFVFALVFVAAHGGEGETRSSVEGGGGGDDGGSW